MEISMDGIEEVTFKKGDVLFQEGESGFFFYIIQEGEVEVYRASARGVNKRLDVLKPGQALGEFALVSQKPRSATARALTDGMAFRVSEENYQKLLADLPGWAFAILSGLIERLRRTNEAISEHTF